MTAATTPTAAAPGPSPVAMVTGSTRGIGRAIALGLARAGFDVAVCGRSSASHDRATAVAAEIEALGRRTVTVAADLADADAAGRLTEEVTAALGRLDVLVLNAARAPFKPLDRLFVRELRQLVGTNLLGNLALVRAALPALEGSGGHVVFISSLGSTLALPSYPLGSLKAAMEVAVRDLGAELRPRGIAVNAVRAGLVTTDSFKTLRLVWPEVGSIPDELVVEPEEVADVVTFLVSPAARGLVGQTLVVDRGLGSRLLL